jgi:dTDP-4-dehydrorhamnose reductase
MKIVLIGPNGQLGTDINKVFSTDPDFTIVPLNHAAVDITDIADAKAIIDSHAPDAVINTAAFHQVDKCEEEVEKTFAVNAAAIKNLAVICKERDIPFVQISTDYVFGIDQERRQPYIETDKPGPVNVYGVSKIAGEMCIQYIAQKYFIVRVAGLFGTAGSSGKGGNFIETMLKIAREKGEVKVKNDEFTSPTYTVDVANNLKALIKNDAYGVYHMTSQGECSWFEFASKIFELTGTKVDCQPVPADNFPTPAKRPRYTVLENAHLKEIGLDQMSRWEDALKKYLVEKGYLTA